MSLYPAAMQRQLSCASDQVLPATVSRLGLRGPALQAAAHLRTPARRCRGRSPAAGAAAPAGGDQHAASSGRTSSQEGAAAAGGAAVHWPAARPAVRPTQSAREAGAGRSGRRAAGGGGTAGLPRTSGGRPGAQQAG